MEQRKIRRSRGQDVVGDTKYWEGDLVINNRPGAPKNTKRVSHVQKGRGDQEAWYGVADVNDHSSSRYFMHLTYLPEHALDPAT